MSNDTMMTSQNSKDNRKKSVKIKRLKENLPFHLTVTSYDSEEQLKEMYSPFINYNMKKLSENHVDLFFEIDATKLD